MSAGVRVELEVIGDGEGADGYLLKEWLTADPTLSGSVTLLRPPEPGRLGHKADILDVLLSRAAVASFVRAITAFLASRRRGVVIRVTFPSGISVELRGDRGVGELGRILAEAMSVALADPPDAGVGDRDHRAPINHGITVGGATHVYNIAVGPVVLGDNVVVRRQSPLGTDDSHRPGSDEADFSTLPITIYLSDEAIHEQVEAAVEDLLATAGLRVERRDDPVHGSWFRRMWATVIAVMRTPVGREAAMVAAHAADTRLVLAQDAAVTATLLQNVGPVIASLQPTKDAVVRAGALLIVKVDWVVTVPQLTAAQQLLLDHHPELARSPHEIIAALKATTLREGDTPPALQ
jgi:hypothetical protein